MPCDQIQSPGFPGRFNRPGPVAVKRREAEIGERTVREVLDAKRRRPAGTSPPDGCRSAGAATESSFVTSTARRRLALTQVRGSVRVLSRSGNAPGSSRHGRAYGGSGRGCLDR